ncbi:carbon storage regulator [archaeon]|jgi:carbon storage regulator|nr:carbon storage regulator [archaeon]
MLVLSRKKNESIVLGPNGEVVLTLVELRGDKARLGIDAPKELPVHRREVYDAITRNCLDPQGKETKKQTYDLFQSQLEKEDYQAASKTISENPALINETSYLPILYTATYEEVCKLNKGLIKLLGEE